MDIVIGSGPAGVAVAHARLAKGQKVTMVDGGMALDTEAIARRDALAAKDPSNWEKAELAAFKAPQFDAPPGVARRYGSDHAQRPLGDIIEDAPENFGLRSSHAVGGLSNLWGSALLPNRQKDIDDWPVTAEDLAPHYEALAHFMPMAGRSDDLARLFPAPSPEHFQPIPPSPQARALARRLEARARKLKSKGLVWGHARQAVDGACRACALCLHGCPWGYIFSGGQAVERLRQDPNFTYRPGRIIDRISEEGQGVVLHAIDGPRIKGRRVFVACGVLETARMLLASFPMLGPEVTLLDSQHMFTPMLHLWRPDGDPENEPHHSLSQIFLELDAADVSPRTIHSQLYTWNEFYAQEMQAKYGKVPGLSKLVPHLARRLIVMQSFLHSDHSARIILKQGSTADRLIARVEENAKTDATMARTRSRLAKLLRPLGLLALTFAGRPGGPGSSFHVGGSFPMRHQPAANSTDPLGRLSSAARVHLVDASVLPSIPSTTITLSVMANAHRIGTHAPT